MPDSTTSQPTHLWESGHTKASAGGGDHTLIKTNKQKQKPQKQASELDWKLLPELETLTGDQGTNNSGILSHHQNPQGGIREG